MTQETGLLSLGQPDNPPLIPADRYRFFDGLLFAVFILLLPPLLASTPRLFQDGDVSWHIAAGKWILENRQVPVTDPFSFTMVGEPWVAHEWLAEVLYALAFDFVGYAGLAAVVAAALMALHLVLFMHLRRRSGPFAILAAIIAVDLILLPFVLARPHVLVWPVVAFWTSALLRCRDAGRAPPPLLALVMLMWVNIHGSFLLGFAIAGAVALDALTAAGWRKQVVAGWAMFGLLSLVAAMINPNGLTAFLHPLSIMGMESLRVIGEWQPSSPSAYPLFYLVLFSAIAALFLRRPRFSPGEAGLLLLLLVLAFSQVRHQSWLGMIAALIVVPRLSSTRDASATPPFGRAWVTIAATVALLGLVARAAVSMVPSESRRNPHGLIAAIAPELRSQPVLNEYSFGGPLILAGVRPYIDGRADMYGDRFVLDYVQIVNGDLERFEQAVGAHDIRWTMLRHDQPLVQALDVSPDWRRVYQDEIGVIHVRTAQPPES